MKLLAFDTSTDACSMALQIDDQRRVDHRVVPQQHAQLLLPALDALLADAGLSPGALDGVVFGRGPGSFTGVRIAAAAAQGLAMAADIGVIGVSSLAAMARVALDEPSDSDTGAGTGLLPASGSIPVFATLDARMGEIYAALFLATRSDGSDWQMHAASEEAVLPPDSTLMQLWHQDSPQCLVVGSGLAAYPQALSMPPGTDMKILTRPNVLPHAGGLLELALPAARAGQWQSAAEAIPTYLRDKVALTQREQQAQRNTSR